MLELTGATLENATTAGQTISFTPTVYNEATGNEVTTASNVALTGGSIQLAIGGAINCTSAGPGTYNTQYKWLLPSTIYCYI
ncbi:MAG: hypothetical protein U5K71_08745 [Gracilimonas sp.]|nr:hypothetical protein [Gracilimonas sp.]